MKKFNIKNNKKNEYVEKGDRQYGLIKNFNLRIRVMLSYLIYFFKFFYT